MLTLGVKRAEDGGEDLFFEIFEGEADDRSRPGEDGRKRLLSNLIERLRRKLGKEAYDRLHATLDQLPPDYFLALRALERVPDELTFATDAKVVSSDSFDTVDKVIEAAEIHHVSRKP